MKNLIVLLILVCGIRVSGQVAINIDGSAPDNSAMLDVKATDRGLLIPRIANDDRNLIPSPATGLLIYNTTTNLFNYYNGSYWYQLETAFISSSFGTISVEGGVSINTSPTVIAEGSAMLDVNNPTRGILIPRTNPDLITAPATGLIIYNTSLNLLSYFNGAEWISLCAISLGVEGAGGSQASIGVAIKMDNSSTHNSAMLDISATNKGVLIPRLTDIQRNEILPATGLVIYNISVNRIEYYNGLAWFQLVTNLLAPPTSGIHVSSPTQIIWNWNMISGATGYKWNTINDYASAMDLDNITTNAETALACNTIYTRYLWSYNSCGYSESVTLMQTTTNCFTCDSSITINHVAGSIAPVNKTVTYGTVTNIPGEPSKCWITQNLGSDHQATAVNDVTEASAGWYWQFNRKQGFKHDGTFRTPNTTWITPIDENLDWQVANDPCALELGSGWRIPSYTEWLNVDESGNWTNWNGPWNSELKLHAAGYLYFVNGMSYYRGQHGFYRSSTQESSSVGLSIGYFNEDGGTYGGSKAYGFSLRCLKELPPSVVTTEVSNIKLNEAISGGNVIDDGGATVNTRGVCWSTSSNPTLANSHTWNGSGTGTFVSELTGLIQDSIYYVRAYATNDVGTSYGNEVSFRAWTCGDPITYSLDGRIYNTALIGTQCWFKENLNVGTKIPGNQNQTNQSSIEKYCYNDLDSNCIVYGGLYQWDNMMKWSHEQGAQGICPSGWHIPTDAEWTVLTTFLGGESLAGGAMKETGTVHWNLPNTGATNSSNFTSIPGGYHTFSGTFQELGANASFWSSTQNSVDSANSLYLLNNYTNSYRSANNQAFGFSARCIQNSNVGDTLSSNAVIIDTITSQLLSDSIQLSQGIYVFQFSGKQPVLDVGEIIVGLTGNGYLRKITSIITPGNPVSLQTQQASMEELFNTVNFGFQKEISLIFDFSNTVIYDNGNLSFTVTEGSVVFNPHFNGELEFWQHGVSKFLLSADNSTLSLNCNVNLHAGTNSNLEAFDIELKKIPTLVPIPGTPLIAIINAKLNAKLDASVDAAIDVNTGFSNTYEANMGMKYMDNAWSSWFNINDNLAVDPVVTTGKVNLVQKFTITPEVNIMFYGIIGPYFTPELWEQIDLSMATPSMDWNSSLDVGLDATFGVTAAIIGNIPNLSMTYPFSYELWNAPNTLEIVSGNNQQGSVGWPLPEPLTVVVKDNLGNPVSEVLVHFQVTQGGGSVSEESVVTNSDGNAETNWTLGYQTGAQVVNACIRDANDETISEQEFTITCSTFMLDGYEAVQIGTQIWMAKNLNIATSNSWCYNNDPAMCSEYGRLYDWNAAMFACPGGWHLPTDDEWTTLSTFLGGDVIAGGKLKETGTTHWLSPNGGATNDSCFSALPGGCYYVEYEEYDDMFGFGYWWSSTESISSTHAKYCFMVFSHARLIRSYADKTFAGFSVRCVKD